MSNQVGLINPRTGLKIKSYSFINQDQVFVTLEKQSHFFKIWKNYSVSKRQLEIKKVIPYLQNKKNEIAESIFVEMGKSLSQANAEVSKCIDAFIKLTTDQIDCLNPLQIKNNTYRESQVFYEPLGVVLSILPFNYPVWQAVRVMLPTILSGNVSLLKSSELTPTACEMIAECFKKAGLQYLVQHQMISVEDLNKIIKHHAIGGISLTGSVQAGIAVYSMAAKALKKVVLELGGNDASLILEDADFQKAIQKIVKSRLQNSGQVCISTKRVFVPKKNKDLILKLFSEEFETVVSSKDSLVGPLASVKLKNEYNLQVSELKKKLHLLVYEKNMNFQNTNDKMSFVNPCLIYFNENDSALKNIEIFGPCLIVIGYDNVKTAIKNINESEYALGAAIYGNDLQTCRQLAQEIVAGQVCINDMIRSDVDLPFGGFKKSGIGRESGQQGFLEFTQTKVISEK